MALWSKKLVRAVAVAAAVGSVATAGATQAAEKVRWGVPIAFASNLTALGDTLPWVVEQLDRSSGGNISLKVLEPGKLIKGTEVFDAVSTGKVEAGYSWMGYEQGKVPASTLFGAVPFGFEPWEFMAWMYYGGGNELVRETYAAHNVVPIFCGIISPETAGWFRFEITSLEQIKGLKIRFAGLGGKIMQKMGASVSVLPGSELFQALEKGVLDATEFSLPSVDQQLGFYKVAKFNYFPGWHQPFTAQYLYVAKAEWDKLSNENRSMIETACIAGVTMSLAKSEALQGPQVTRFQAEGVKAVKLPDDILRELKKASDEVMAEESAKDPIFKKVLESQRTFAAGYAPWKHFGYLPRDWK